MWHYVRTEDNILRFIIQGRKPTVWMEGGWAEKLRLPPVTQGTGMPSADAQALHIDDLAAFKQYTKDVWASTASWLANPDTAVFDTPVTVKPLLLSHAETVVASASVGANRARHWAAVR